MFGLLLLTRCVLRCLNFSGSAACCRCAAASPGVTRTIVRVVLLAAAAFSDSNFLLLRAASHLAAADSAAPRITRTIVRFVISCCAAGKKIFAASLRYGDKSCSSFSSVCCFWLPRTRTILRFITPIQNFRCAGRFAAAANPNNLSAYIPANSSLNHES